MCHWVLMVKISKYIERDENGQLTLWKTGRRYVYNVDSASLFQHDVKIGLYNTKFTTRVRNRTICWYVLIFSRKATSAGIAPTPHCVGPASRRGTSQRNKRTLSPDERDQKRGMLKKTVTLPRSCQFAFLCDQFSSNGLQWITKLQHNIMLVIKWYKCLSGDVYKWVLSNQVKNHIMNVIILALNCKRNKNWYCLPPGNLHNDGRYWHVEERMWWRSFLHYRPSPQ